MRVYIDMDDVLCAFTAAHRKALEINSEIRYPQSVEGFFLMLEPLPGAIEVVNEFRSKFEVYILTAPSTRNPLCYTEKRLWIEKHFDYEFTNQLIISPNKGLMIGDYLIDDHIEGRGQEDFTGELIHFGSEDYPDWQCVRTYLAQKFTETV
ncbi:MAG: hypothetical protein P1U89_20840 [Verrucomicrobiales bacterium]|nr:hypothetical protein [Verrucomicrobiales bacterium]